MANIAAADDDVAVQAVVKRVLGRAGHEVTTHSDGAALVEAVRATHPDVVITDNEMPVMTGLQAAQALHSDPDTAEIPIVFASGSVSAASAAEILREGDQVVPKPFTPFELKRGVDAALEARHTRHDQTPDSRTGRRWQSVDLTSQGTGGQGTAGPDRRLAQQAT